MGIMRAMKGGPDPAGPYTQQEGQAASRPRACAPMPALRPRAIGRGNGGRARKRAGGGAGAPAPAVRASRRLTPAAHGRGSWEKRRLPGQTPPYLPQRFRAPALQCPPRAAG